MDNIVLAVSTLAAFLLGSWVTYRAMQHKSPVDIPQIIKDMTDDLPEPISPYEEGKKNRVEKVKL
jgi:hypothetical protein